MNPVEPRMDRLCWQDYCIFDLTEKMAPWDEAYKRGKAISGRAALERVEKSLWAETVRR